MGLYLDSSDSLTLYKKIRDSKWYIDKTEILSELIDRIGTTENYICVTRPRRFGKTVAANMIAAYFSQNLDSKAIFDGSKISENPNYDKFINSYHVISIDFSKVPFISQDFIKRSGICRTCVYDRYFTYSQVFKRFRTQHVS